MIIALESTNSHWGQRRSKFSWSNRLFSALKSIQIHKKDDMFRGVATSRR